MYIMIMRILIMFSFIWLLSGCLPALASDYQKLLQPLLEECINI